MHLLNISVENYKEINFFDFFIYKQALGLAENPCGGSLETYYILYKKLKHLNKNSSNFYLDFGQIDVFR